MTLTLLGKSHAIGTTKMEGIAARSFILINSATISKTERELKYWLLKGGNHLCRISHRDMPLPLELLSHEDLETIDLAEPTSKDVKRRRIR